MDKLCDLVEQMSKQNRVLAERLASYESGSAVAHTGTAQRLVRDVSMPAEEQQQLEDANIMATSSEETDEQLHPNTGKNALAT